MKMQTPKEIHGEPAWSLASGPVSLSLTKRGGHLGPVAFSLPRNRVVEPYSKAPWKPRECEKGTPPILQVLRGDFFCLPFGVSDSVPGVHGDPANLSWRLVKEDHSTLTADLRLRQFPGKIRKTVSLDGENRAVYQEHQISGLEGPFNYGHHAILEFPEEGGPFYFNTSPIRFGGIKPPPYDNPSGGEYGSLPSGATFKHLRSVPTVWGGKVDLREYPAREGFEDLVMVSAKPTGFAWTAATLDGYVWFSLKDTREFPSTMMWFSNGGRHGPPWNGLHRRRLGLEEVCSFFSDGLDISRTEPLQKKYGIPCTRKFNPDETVSLRIVQGVHPVPKNFGMVTDLRPLRGEDAIVIMNAVGKKIRVPVKWSFLAGVSA